MLRLINAHFESLIIVCLIFVPCLVYGQDLSKGSRWKAGLTLSASHVITPNKESLEINIPTDDVTGFYVYPKNASYYVGLASQYSLNSKIDIVTGIGYSTKDYEASPYCHVCDFGGIPQTIDQDFLEIPISLRYNFPLKWVNLHFEGGLISSFLIKNNNEIGFFPDELAEGNFVMSSSFGMGVNKEIASKVNLSLTLGHVSPIVKLTRNEGFELQSLGLMANFLYNI